MEKSFVTQTEPRETSDDPTDGQCLMFKWKENKLENPFGDKIEETTTDSVGLRYCLTKTQTTVFDTPLRMYVYFRVKNGVNQGGKMSR